MSKRRTAADLALQRLDAKIDALILARAELLEASSPPAPVKPARPIGPKRAPGLPAAEKVG